MVAARWAELLVDYCLQVEHGETIVLSSSVIAQPLVEACFKAIVLRGGHPLLRLELPGLHEFFLENASEDQLAIFAAAMRSSRPSRSSAPDPDRGRKRHPLDEPRRPAPAGGCSTALATRSARPPGTGDGS